MMDIKLFFFGEITKLFYQTKTNSVPKHIIYSQQFTIVNIFIY